MSPAAHGRNGFGRINLGRPCEHVRIAPGKPAANLLTQRSHIGHELATRARYGVPCGAVYRVVGGRVDVSIYSIGSFDVATLSAERGGGGHRNAAGFTLPLDTWIRDYL